MGYQLLMHRAVRDWLTNLRDSQPELARLVGEAVLALLDAGESLGPPLVVAPESVIGAGDPRETLDLSYERQLELLQRVRRSVADVATSRKRVELQVSQQEQRAAALGRQREDALDAGREDLASDAQAREARAQEQLSELRSQLAILMLEEKKLAAASLRLQAKVDSFRIQKETIKARYTAAEASQSFRDAVSAIEAEAGEQEAASAAEGGSGEPSGAAPEDQFLRELREPMPGIDSEPGPEDQDDASSPHGIMELRPGAPGNVRVGLLFAVQPQDTAMVVAYVTNPGGPPDDCQEVIRIAKDRLAAAQSSPGAATADPVTFISYDAESFLDEFFPGEETEVEIGAGALAARNRAHTLAEARQRLMLTQAQVARRMQVRQERVSAIERAEPGATEVRTLASYVNALGGRLEIIAHVGNERIILR
jgi:DNA-binding XRE family transcriptional regulator